MFLLPKYEGGGGSRFEFDNDICISGYILIVIAQVTSTLFLLCVHWCED
jgi:hypothetical protein